MERYQIRSRNFGLAIIEADTPMKALIKYVEQQGGDVLDISRVSQYGILWNGILYETRPPS